jgi:uncharacterized protein with HEPN domain
MSAKIEFLLKMIDEIEGYKTELGSIEAVLNNKMAFNATLMNLLQIGETLNKLDKNILKEHGLLEDAKGAYKTRNFIAHDYEGVNKAVVEDILRNYLPRLRQLLTKINN